MPDCVVPGCEHDNFDCVTEAEANMGLGEFLSRLVADEGMPPRDADRYKAAILKATE